MLAPSAIAVIVELVVAGAVATSLTATRLSPFSLTLAAAADGSLTASTVAEVSLGFTSMSSVLADCVSWRGFRCSVASVVLADRTSGMVVAAPMATSAVPLSLTSADSSQGDDIDDGAVCGDTVAGSSALVDWSATAADRDTGLVSDISVTDADTGNAAVAAAGVLSTSSNGDTGSAFTLVLVVISVVEVVTEMSPFTAVTASTVSTAVDVAVTTTQQIHVCY